jgi:hypothetical protein
MPFQDKHPESTLEAAALMAIGNQLRAEYSILGCPDLIHDRLLSLVGQLQEGEQGTPATGSVDAEQRGATILRFPPKSPHRDIRPTALSARETGELWRFEMLLLGLLENNLEGPARDAAIRKLGAYARVCPAALQVRDSYDKDFEVLRG